MYHRMRSFGSGMIKCKAPLNGSTFAEEVSMLSSDDIATAVARRDAGLPTSGTASRFLTAVTTSCRPVGHSNEAAAYARRQYFALMDRFGSCSLFVTVTPDDECSFRVRLYASSGKEHCLPSFTWTDAECLADLDIRKKTRVKYPGACSLEFQSMMQIVVEAIIGWDTSSGTETRGIFGVPIALAAADEEQGRYTLHRHLQVWVKQFNKLRDLMHLSTDSETRQSAKDELVRYANKVMHASYGDAITVEHRCKEDNVVESPADEILQPVPYQDLRDARHQNHCEDLAGKVLECTRCNLRFTTPEVVSLALERWYQQEAGDSAPISGFPISRARQDMCAIRQGYDIADGKLAFYDPNNQERTSTLDRRLDGSETTDEISFWFRHCVRHSILRQRFDEHAFTHANSCFKKGCECRFFLPKHLSKETEIIFDNENMVTWHYVDLNRQPTQTCAFQIYPKRLAADLYLNVHNMPLSEIIGCNTNVQIGDPVHCIYTTLYSSKNTQKEDTKKHLMIGNQLTRRINRAMQVDSPDYVEGLARFMSGISAHLSNHVVSATMGHLLVCQQSRFWFSHEFSQLPLSQMEDYAEGKPVSFMARKVKAAATEQDDEEGTESPGSGGGEVNEGTGEKSTRWPDLFVNDVLHRPEQLEDVCAYEQMMRYYKIYPSKKLREQAPVEDECEEEEDKLYFLDDHPGQKYVYLKKSKQELVPMISTRDPLPNVADLDLHSESPSQAACALREKYARKALMLFLPFRDFDDLKGEDGFHWTRYLEARENNELSQIAFEILQNMQDRENCKDIKRPDDPIQEATTCKPSEGNTRRQRDNDDEYDMDVSEFDDSIPTQEGGSRDMDALRPQDRRTRAAIRNKSTIRKQQLVKARIIQQQSAVTTDGTEEGEEIQEEDTSYSSGNGSIPHQDFPTIIEFIQGTLVDGGVSGENSNAQRQEEPGTPPSMNAISNECGLDEKQTVAYEVICCTYLLQVIREEATSAALDSLFAALPEQVNSQREDAIAALRARGGKDQLLMYLTGAGGCGKSHSIYAAQKFCHRFSQAAGVVFGKNTFWFTACTGSAAAIWGGVTIHSAAKLNSKSIYDDDRENWKNVRILIIDEISYFSEKDLIKLDRCLKKLVNQEQQYGGMSIVFAGDFHQLRTITGEPLYSRYSAHWQGSLNCAITLENYHRFSEDPEYGQLLARLRRCEETIEDRRTLNTRSGVPFPTDGDICYACPKNDERNAINIGIFSELVAENCPSVESDENPPENIVIIEASARKKKTKCSQLFHDTIIQNCGDSHIKTSHNKKIDPALNFYPGVPLMINSNEHLDKTPPRGNGTLCIGKTIKLKRGRSLQWKNYEGRKVFVADIDDCMEMTCAFPRKSDDEPEKKFKIVPEEDSVVISLQMYGNTVKIGGLKMKQFGVNNNIATTGHKLQGMSKDQLIVSSWNYSFKNWIYVVLSRVRTLSGLYLCQPIDETRPFPVDDTLLVEERRLEQMEEELMEHRRQNM